MRLLFALIGVVLIAAALGSTVRRCGDPSAAVVLTPRSASSTADAQSQSAPATSGVSERRALAEVGLADPERASDREPEGESPPTPVDASAALESALRVLPPYDGTDAGIRAKYARLDAAQLNVAYHQLSAILREETRAIMAERAARGEFEELVSEPGTPIQLPLQTTDSTPVVLGYSSEQVGDAILSRLFEFRPGDRPDHDLRTLEVGWVHQRLHELRACTHCPGQR
jgi:hypothetical protein